jgi:hypothetical protein
MFMRLFEVLRRGGPPGAYGTVAAITGFAGLLLLVGAVPAAAQERTQAATIRGVVVDARTGAPLPKVLVAAEGGRSTESASDGTFTLPDLPPGALRLYVSAVGYGLVQRSLNLAPGAVLDVRVPLSEGAATYTEELTVTADRFRRPDPGVPAQQALGGAELQNLRGVLADDALRAVQVLPGVATGDDFRSEFSVRGSDFAHLNFTVDGFATPFLMHMVRAVEERANTGSVAMINSDVLEQVVLSSGGYAQRSGNRTGGEVAFTLREGTRERVIVRAAVSGTSASGTVEGPLGRSRRGSWLVSGRKSYLDLIIDRLADEGLSFGFADAQAKFRYDLNPRHSVALTLLAGDSRLEELPDDQTDNTAFTGNNASTIAIATWRGAFGRALVSAGAMASGNRFNNHTNIGIPLEEGRTAQTTGRVDLTYSLTPRLQVESGAIVEHTTDSQKRRRLQGSTNAILLNEFRDAATRTGGHARLRVDVLANGRFSLLPGVRADHWGLTGQSTISPWLQAEWALPFGLTMRGATGVYQQFPDFEEVVGAFAGIDVKPERSVHADLSVERRLSPATRVQFAIYQREDDEVIRRPGADTRLVAGRVVRGSRTATYANRLSGYARGAEVLVQRSAPAGMSGWLSYAYGRNRYEDVVSGEEYWGDLDQRHTFNAYGFYRFSHRLSASVKLRMGSNFPAPGYYAKDGDLYVLSHQRNELRLPSYSRLDLRVNRTFDWSRRRLTLFAEVLNVLNNDNVRFNPPSVNSTTRRVTHLFESLVPVVPSAGILLEF